MRDIKKFYEFGEKLGSGKFGLVTEGFEIKTNKKVAIKTINKLKLEGIEHEMVRTEVEVMFFCRHQNIAKCLDHFEDYENIYIVLEFYSGGTLITFLSVQETILPESKVKEVLYQIAKGIEYLHYFGIMHRDLKPDNLMMSSKDYNNSLVKIVDFGLSKIHGIKELSNDSYGTLSFASPEIINRRFYNNTIDIWSLGVLTYYLIAGYLPFTNKGSDTTKIANLITNMSERYDDVIWGRFSLLVRDLTEKCLEKDYENRIGIKEFLNHGWFKDLKNKK